MDCVVVYKMATELTIVCSPSGFGCISTQPSAGLWEGMCSKGQ